MDDIESKKRAEEGFAIKCPHCGNWDIYKEDPQQFTIEVKDIDAIMERFHKAVEEGSIDNFLANEKRMFRCTQPRWICPASFEAFIFTSEQKALKALAEIREKWAIPRDFRLYKANERERWDSGKYQYFGIIFCTEPVYRLRDIEMEHLIDIELASKIIKGVTQEVSAPLTFFAANILEKEDDACLFWMPIEAYSDEYPFVPSEYNLFCQTLRRRVSKKLYQDWVNDFDQKPIGPENCKKKNIFYNPRTKKCMDREPACQNRLDVNHCPIFIKKRLDNCPCYRSDKSFIDNMLDNLKKVKNMWNKEELQVERTCPAGFTEVAIPIVVHEHLVGVAMTGQVFFNRSDIVNHKIYRDKLRGIGFSEKQIKSLEDYESEMETMRHVLLWQEGCLDGKGNGAKANNGKKRFFLDNGQWANRKKALKKKIDKMEQVMEAQYREVRNRSENAFRDELRGIILYGTKKSSKEDINSFFEGDQSPITNILERMRTFWAFRVAAYLWLDVDSSTVRLIGYVAKVKKAAEEEKDREQKGYNFPGREVGEVEFKIKQEHPISWLWDPESEIANELPHNESIKQIFIRLKDSEVIKKLNLPQSSCYFIVVVPFEGSIYGFVFLTRDKENFSRTPGKKSVVVSELCQEHILRTCTEMAYELHEVRHRIVPVKSTGYESDVQKARQVEIERMSGISREEDS